MEKKSLKLDITLLRDEIASRYHLASKNYIEGDPISEATYQSIDRAKRVVDECEKVELALEKINELTLRSEVQSNGITVFFFAGMVSEILKEVRGE